MDLVSLSRHHFNESKDEEIKEMGIQLGSSKQG